LSSASNTSLAKVRMSPALSPFAPVSVTASVVACSIIFSSCGSAAAGRAATNAPATIVAINIKCRHGSGFKEYGMTTSLSVDWEPAAGLPPVWLGFRRKGLRIEPVRSPSSLARFSVGGAALPISGEFELGRLAAAHLPGARRRLIERQSGQDK